MLGPNSYGKSGIRLVKVTRHPDRHDLKDLTIAIRLEGDFEKAHTVGDNSAVLPTDTMKNTVYALASEGSLEEIESFGMVLARHFVESHAPVSRARIEISEHSWERLDVSGRPHRHAFRRAGEETRLARVVARSRRRAVRRGRNREPRHPQDRPFGFCGVSARPLHDPEGNHGPDPRHGALGRLDVRRVGTLLQRALEGRAPDASRDLRGPRQPIRPAHPPRDGRGRPRAPRRSAADPPDDAQQAPPGRRPVALWPAERERDLRGDRGAVTD